jgi:SAM-dependent methyltransferase
MTSRSSAENSFPLNCTSDTEFAAAAGFFRNCGFQEASICERLGIAALPELDSPLKMRQSSGLRLEEDANGLCILLFVLGHCLPRAVVEAHLAADVVAALRSLDLIRLDEDRDGYFSPVTLVSVALPSHTGPELLIACDRKTDLSGNSIPPFADFVFSGHNPLTRQFLRILPASRTRQVLDLCTGTGVAALASAVLADRVVAVDIAARSVHFATFNCRLNQARNVEVLEGDLYAPAEGQTFDRILAHPPYVPSFLETPIYRDGGETGDKVLHRIVAQAPDYLKPGGTFHILGIAMDFKDLRYEARARGWMNNREDFDLVFALQEPKGAEDFGLLLGSRIRGPGGREVFERWMELVHSLHIDQAVYGVLTGRRHAEAGRAQTRRVQLNPDISGAVFERVLEWFDWVRKPDLVGRVLRSRLEIAPTVRLEITYQVQSGSFEPSAFRMAAGDRMFPALLQVDPWVVSVVSGFETGKEALQVYESLKGQGKIPEDMSTSAFADLLCHLVEKDILRLGEGGDRTSF